MKPLNKNIDGVKKIRKTTLTIQPKLSVRVVTSQINKASQKSTQFRHTSNWKVYVPIAILGLVITFGLGMMTALHTPKTSAQDEAVPAPVNFTIPMPDAQVATGAPAISNDVLFNTPLQMLQDYLAAKVTPNVLESRKAKLTAYLQEKNSPLETEAKTIAEQDHWKLILAISFAESTLGKRCYFNNCSGIGGSNIKTYKSLKNWILDFNRLLEKRYKDKTLEQMCGVYVQPCNSNWLLATKQILSELKEQGIE